MDPISGSELDLLVARNREIFLEQQVVEGIDDSDDDEDEGRISPRVTTATSAAAARGMESRKSKRDTVASMLIIFKKASDGSSQLKPLQSRENSCVTFCRVEDYSLILNGKWHQDQIWTRGAAHNARKPSEAWCHLLLPGERAGRFYFGELTAKGERHGVGVLYDERADEDQDFRERFEAGECWDKMGHPKDWPLQLMSEDFRNCKFEKFLRDFLKNDKYKETLKYITYFGQWHENLPEGNGIQHFSDPKTGGTYLGQFHRGERHGRGVWITNDGARQYRPIKRKNVLVPNWDKDTMHGVGIVEDKQHIHENIIYTHGKCHMPYVDFGPPSTGFGTLGAGIFKMRAKDEKSAPKATLVHKGKKTAAHDVEAVDPNETTALRGAGNARGLAAARYQQDPKAFLGQAASMAMQADDEETMALVREPTDLDLPEEDISIEGGTGENAVLNGLYFKMSGTFGIQMYRNVQRSSGFSLLGASYTQRYLFKDGISGCWIISDKTSGGLQIEPGMAFAEDAKAETPAKVTSDWYVWHTHSRTMRSLMEEESRAASEETKSKNTKPREELKKHPVDALVVKSILGFAVSYDEVDTGPKAGLYLRHGSQLYSRPVYESEFHGTDLVGGAGEQCQFLYWMENDGSLSKGRREDDLKEVGLGKFQRAGYWAIGQLGATKTQDGCLAYCEDIAATPNAIQGKWCLRRAGGKFAVDPKFELKLQEWTGGVNASSTGAGSPSPQKPSYGSPQGGELQGLAALDLLSPQPFPAASPSSSSRPRGGELQGLAALDQLSPQAARPRGAARGASSSPAASRADRGGGVNLLSPGDGKGSTQPLLSR